MPDVREYLRFETYLGRYVQSNLFAISWLERMLQVEQDQNDRIFDWVMRKFFYNPIYHSVTEKPELYV